MFNSATAVGSHSAAEAAFGASGGNGNLASATGDYAHAFAGVPNGIGSEDVPSGDSNTATAQGFQAFAWASYDGSSNNVANAIGDNTYVVTPVADSGDGTDFWADLWHLFS